MIIDRPSVGAHALCMNDDLEYKRAVYEQFVKDNGTRNLAFDIAQNGQVQGDPELAIGDLEAARRYVWVCVRNMGASEAAALTPAMFAGLWARGIRGAAAWRERHKRTSVAPVKPTRGRKIRRKSEE